MVKSLQELSLRQLLLGLLEGRAYELERLPERLALDLLQRILSEWCEVALGQWVEKRKVRELQLTGQMAGMKKLIDFNATGALKEVSLRQMNDLSDDLLMMLLSKSRVEILQLEACPYLTGRFLDRSNHSFRSLKELRCSQCPALQEVFLCNGLADLHLIHLSLSGSTNLTNGFVSMLGGAAPAPLPPIAQCLEYLDLSQTQVTDEGASTLARLSTLQVLILSRTKVSMACLRHLAKVLHLQALLPDRPKLLLRNFSCAQRLEVHRFRWAALAPGALEPETAQWAEWEAWPEEAVRHAAVMRFLRMSDRGRAVKRELDGERLVQRGGKRWYADWC